LKLNLSRREAILVLQKKMKSMTHEYRGSCLVSSRLRSEILSLLTDGCPGLDTLWFSGEKF
jgi:hypothetical protein